MIVWWWELTVLVEQSVVTCQFNGVELKFLITVSRSGSWIGFVGLSATIKWKKDLQSWFNTDFSLQMPTQGKGEAKYQINELEMRNRSRNKQNRINKFRIA